MVLLASGTSLGKMSLNAPAMTAIVTPDRRARKSTLAEAAKERTRSNPQVDERPVALRSAYRRFRTGP